MPAGEHGGRRSHTDKIKQNEVPHLIYQQLTHEFLPVSKSVGHAGSHLLKCYNSFQEALTLYCDATHKLIKSADTAIPEARQHASELASVFKEFVKFVNEHEPIVKEFETMTIKANNYSSREKDKLKSDINDFKKQEKRLIKDKSDQATMKQFYEKAEHDWKMKQVLRYKFYNDKVSAWINKYHDLIKTIQPCDEENEENEEDEGKEETNNDNSTNNEVANIQNEPPEHDWHHEIHEDTAQMMEQTKNTVPAQEGKQSRRATQVSKKEERAPTTVEEPKQNHSAVVNKERADTESSEATSLDELPGSPQHESSDIKLLKNTKRVSIDYVGEDNIEQESVKSHDFGSYNLEHLQNERKQVKTRDELVPMTQQPKPRKESNIRKYQPVEQISPPQQVFEPSKHSSNKNEQLIIDRRPNSKLPENAEFNQYNQFYQNNNNSDFLPKMPYDGHKKSEERRDSNYLPTKNSTSQNDGGQIGFSYINPSNSQYQRDPIQPNAHAPGMPRKERIMPGAVPVFGLVTAQFPNPKPRNPSYEPSRMDDDFNDNRSKRRTNELKYNTDANYYNNDVRQRGMSNARDFSNEGIYVQSNFNSSNYGSYLKVIDDFNASSGEQITVNRGDMVVLLKSGTRGWVFVRDTVSNRTGWIPEPYVQL